MTQTLTELSHHSQTWRIAVSKLQPLINLIEDDTVSEILLSNYKNTRVDRQGVLENIEGVAFASDEALFEAVQQIAKSLNQDYDRNAYPILDGRLPNGYRIHSIAYPYAVHGTTLNIRKFDNKLFTPEQLIEWEMLSAEMYQYLAVAMRMKSVMLLSGGTGSGKTSLLKVLAANNISPHEQVVSVEGTHELQQLKEILGDGYIALEAVNKSTLESSPITLHGFIAALLRMRADRTIIGELRTPEEVDAFITLLNAGFGGVIATIHANSAPDTLSRMDYLLLTHKPNLNMESVRNIVRSNVEVIAYIERDQKGRRRVIEIAEVSNEGANVLWRYNRRLKQHERVAEQSKVLEKARERGLLLEASDARDCQQL